MPKAKLKPPTETREDLVNEITNGLKGINDPVSFLLGYFTTLDLVGIRNEINDQKDSNGG